MNGTFESIINHYFTSGIFTYTKLILLCSRYIIIIHLFIFNCNQMRCECLVFLLSEHQIHYEGFKLYLLPWLTFHIFSRLLVSFLAIIRLLQKKSLCIMVNESSLTIRIFSILKSYTNINIPKDSFHKTSGLNCMIQGMKYISLSRNNKYKETMIIKQIAINNNFSL